MTQALRSVAGVDDVDVDFDKKQAHVSTKRCTHEAFEEMSAALRHTGYDYDGVVIHVAPRGYQPP